MLKIDIARVKKSLIKPFPFFESYWEKLLIPILPTLFVMLGVVILNWSSDYGILLGRIVNVFAYGLIVILISIIFSLVLPLIFPKIFDEEKWNVLKTLIFILILILTITSVISTIAYKFDNSYNLDLSSFIVIIFIKSIVFSFFPIIIIVFYFEGVLHKKNHLIALNIIDEINNEKQIEQKIKSRIFTFAKNTKDEILIAEDNLIFIKAEGNYCNLFYKNNDNVITKLIRSNMKELELYLKKSSNFIRSHKSYIINLSFISDVTGNARGYLFHLANFEYKIPGSRNLSKSLISEIKAFNTK